MPQGPSTASSSASSSSKKQKQKKKAGTGASASAVEKEKERPVWLLFEEAQYSLWDKAFWECLQKAKPNVYVVLFGKFGVASATGYHNINHHRNTNKDNARVNVPVYIPPQRRIGLRHKTPGAPGPSVCLGYEEFRDCMQKRREVIEGASDLDEDLVEWMFWVTEGHVSAANALYGVARDVLVRLPYSLIYCFFGFFGVFMGGVRLISLFGGGSGSRAHAHARSLSLGLRGL